MIQAEEGVEPSPARLNALLRGFMSGYLTFWAAANDKTLVAFFVTSKHVGGPVGGGQMYLSYLRGLENIPPTAWEQAVKLLQAHMRVHGCQMLIASTSNEKIKTVAESLGAESDYRLIWRI